MGKYNIGWENIAGPIIGAGMGLALEGHNDRRQREQNQALIDQQTQAQKNLMTFQNEKQYEMWLKTNYGAQVEQLNKAGLNPGLLYGMSGGGGITTGAGMPSAPHVDAPKGGGEVLNMAGMGLQLGMQQAQTNLLKAQTENVKADTAKKSGVDTAEGYERIEKLAQETDNLRHQNDLLKLDKQLQHLINWEAQQTQSDRMTSIQNTAEQSKAILTKLKNDASFSTETLNTAIKITKQNLIGAVLDNVIRTSTNENIKSETWLNSHKVKEITNKIMLGWDTLSNDNKKIMIQDQLKEWHIDPNNKAVDQMINALDNLLYNMPLEPGKRNPVGFKSY